MIKIITAYVNIFKYMPKRFLSIYYYCIQHISVVVCGNIHIIKKVTNGGGVVLSQFSSSNLTNPDSVPEHERQNRINFDCFDFDCIANGINL